MDIQDFVVIFVTCDYCQTTQAYHSQHVCDACKQRFSPFSIASQLLKLQKEAHHEGDVEPGVV